MESDYRRQYVLPRFSLDRRITVLVLLASAVGLVVPLPAAAAIRGRIVGLDAEELGRVEVSAYARGYGSLEGQVRGDGSFLVPGLAVGNWNLRARLENPDRSAASVWIYLARPGEVVDVELRLEPGG